MRSMQAEVAARSAQGHFRWSGGGWFGTAIGGSAWMVVAATFLAVHDSPRLAWVPAACAAATIALAWALWRRRERLDPFLAILMLLTALAIANPIAWFAISRWGSPGALARMNWPTASGWDLVVPLLAPLLMVGFYFLERRGRDRG
jgi:hypothetical protein